MEGVGNPAVVEHASLNWLSRLKLERDPLRTRR